MDEWDHSRRARTASHELQGPNTQSSQRRRTQRTPRSKQGASRRREAGRERERRHKTTSEADWSLSENPSVTSGRAVSMERRGESQVMLG